VLSVEASKADKAIDVALAEFQALRNEIISHITTQAAVVGLGLTALGVVFGVTVNNGEERLLLAAPPIALLVVMLHMAETFRCAKIGTYVRDQLWPFLQERVGDETMPSWEVETARIGNPLGAFARALIIDFPAMAIFVVASGAAVWLAPRFDLLWWLGLAMTLASIAVPAVLGLKIHAEFVASPALKRAEAGRASPAQADTPAS
jgi:hypothetical protein